MNIFFERIVGLLPRDVRLIQQDKSIGYNYIRIDISNNFRLAALDSIAYFDFSQVAIKDINIHDLIKAINQHSDSDRIRIVYLVDKTLFEKYKENIPNIIFIDDILVKNIIKSNNTRDAFRKILQDNISKEILIPYRHLGAVTGNNFFGRDRQLNTIINNPKKSYLISGIRTSGKSSLLLEARNRIRGSHLGDRYPSSTTIKNNVASVDCRSVGNISQLLSRILIDLGEKTSNSQPEKWPTNRISEFGHKLKKIASDNADGNVRIFLDEYDKALDFENKENFQLTWAFRNMYNLNANNDGVIQFLIAGSKNLSIKCKENDSAFYNFFDYEETRLENFDLGTITKILSEPLEDLGIQITDPNAVSNQILKETSGRPANVQYLCNKMVEALVSGNKKRVDTSLVSSITNNGGYIRHYSDSIYQNIDSLQKLLLFFCSEVKEDEGATFTIHSMQNSIVRHGFRVDDKVLRSRIEDLVNSGLLNEVQIAREPRFSLSHSHLLKIIFSKIDYNSLVGELVSNGFVTKI